MLPILQREWEILSRIDANYCFRAAKEKALEFQPGFVLDGEIKETFKALALYMAEDPLFEEKGHGMLNKGICLMGDVGVGKTLLAKAFSRYNYQRKYYTEKPEIAECINHKVVNTCSIVNNYCGEYGIKEIENYKYGPYCFDDLGAEQIPAFNMGNKKNVMAEIIQNRYNTGNFYGLMFTTNLDGQQTEDLYGIRIRSRLREMVNFIIVPGKDRRK
jgi:DNA replication protein DnaC